MRVPLPATNCYILSMAKNKNPHSPSASWSNTSVPSLRKADMVGLSLRLSLSYESKSTPRPTKAWSLPNVEPAVLRFSVYLQHERH